MFEYGFKHGWPLFLEHQQDVLSLGVQSLSNAAALCRKDQPLRTTAVKASGMHAAHADVLDRQSRIIGVMMFLI